MCMFDMHIVYLTLVITTLPSDMLFNLFYLSLLYYPFFPWIFDTTLFLLCIIFWHFSCYLLKAQCLFFLLLPHSNPIYFILTSFSLHTHVVICTNIILTLHLGNYPELRYTISKEGLEPKQVHYNRNENMNWLKNDSI